MALGCVLDAGVGIAIVVAAIWGNSLTLYGESIRGWLLLTLEIVLYFLLRRINRGAMPDYDYGTNKLEQFANFAVGSALILGALWLLAGMVERMGVVQQQSDSGMIFAAAISLLNLAINLGIFITLWRAGRQGASIILNGQILARLAKTISSVLVTLAVMVNAWAGDVGLGAWADLFGTAVVVAVMLVFGGQMVAGAMPHLIDRALGELNQAAINRVLAGRFDSYDALLAVRTRTQGCDAWVEIEIGFAAGRSMGEVTALADAMAQEIRAVVPGARVLVVPRAVPA